MSSSLRRDPLVLMFALLIVGFGVGSLPNYLEVSTSSSVPYHLFFKLNAAGARIKKYDYVNFPISSKYIEGGEKVILVKQVVCVAGETLNERGNEYLCNGNEFLGRAKDTTLKGEKLEHFNYSGVIPKGYVYVAGTNKDSYDSRYFGFVKKSDILYKAYPIL